MQDTIAALVGSRICHDLISPIGAIGNGVELLSLTDGDSTAEMALINESVENANARIRFFRIAYGAASEDQTVSRSEVMSILGAVARGGRFTYFWQVEADQPRRDVRAAFLMLQCLEAAMPMGGDITVSYSGGTWSLTATGERLNIQEDVWEGLTKVSPGVTHSAAQVQFALLPSVLIEAGRKLTVKMAPATISAQF